MSAHDNANCKERPVAAVLLIEKIWTLLTFLYIVVLPIVQHYVYRVQYIYAFYIDRIQYYMQLITISNVTMIYKR